MLPKTCCGIGRHKLTILILLGTFLPRGLGQEPAAPTPAEVPATNPAEPDLRLTPGMARAMGTVLTREIMVRRYGLDEARAQEVSEKIARRLMRAAQANEKQAQQFIEYSLPGLVEAEIQGGPEYVSRDFWAGFSKEVLPLVPAIRQLFGDIRQDVQPLLPPGQQLKMAGDLLAVGATINAFEKTMERWSAGDVTPGENPFNDGEGEIKKDENGESEPLRQARKRAEEPPGNRQQAAWKKYVEQARDLYGFDEAQNATADSILREAVQRAEAVLKDEAWLRQARKNRFWAQFLWRLPPARSSPLPDFIGDDYLAMTEPVRAIGDELKERIDRIPTQPQRDAATARIRKALAATGVATTEP